MIIWILLYKSFLSYFKYFRIISKDICNYFISLVSNNCKYRVQQDINRKDFLQRLIDINKESEASGEGTGNLKKIIYYIFIYNL